MKKYKDRVLGVGMKLIAWFSWFGAVVAGVAASGCFVGKLFAAPAALFPTYIAFSIFGAGALVTLIDLASDGIPDMPAVLLAITLPSFVSGISGAWGTALHGWFAQVTAWALGFLGNGIGSTPILGVFVVFATLSLFAAAKVLTESAQSAKSVVMSGR